MSSRNLTINDDNNDEITSSNETSPLIVQKQGTPSADVRHGQRHSVAV